MRNLAQEEIIQRAKLPALVLAGPGTGKTHTIVNFVAEAIKNGRFDPNKILITTFTKKAARELNTRIITKLRKENIKVDFKDIMIGNFHSLAMDFIKKYRKLDDNFFSLTVIDSYMEEYIIKENLDLFRKLPGFTKLIKKDAVGEILEIFQSLTNYLVDLNDLKNSPSEKDQLAYGIYLTYEKILQDLGLINFQLILKRFYDLLTDPIIGDVIRKEIDLVVIDEYQDTNHIQEEIAFNLTKDGNIIVFGDDDQALYSFRGADANNLLDFDEKYYRYSKLRPTVYKLDINYRSDQFIVEKSTGFINQAKTSMRKDLKAVEETPNPNTIVRARADNISNIVNIVSHLSKKVDPSQIAFLFHSFFNPFPAKLEKALTDAGLRVINRKSDRYFHRKEIRFLIFILMKYMGISEIRIDFDERFMSYYQRKKNSYRKYLKSILDDESLKEDIVIRTFIQGLDKDLALSKIAYKALGLDYYKNLIDKDEANARLRHKNTGKFINLCVDFDDIFSNTENFYEKFIFSYLYIYFSKNALAEYDEEDIGEDGINFMTIHQAKGLEFEIVFVSSLNDFPRKDKEKFLSWIHEERGEEEIDLDFYRKYYTAFTRAKKLLVVFDNSRDMRIKRFVGGLDSSSRLSSIDFVRKRPEKEKQIFAFTTDISPYETCPRKYYFLRYLGYKSPKTQSLIFGSRVHALAEYIYSTSFSKDDLGKFLRKNPAYVDPVSNLLNKGFEVCGSEVNYKTDRGDFILQGSIDLILKDGSIVDLKTGSINEMGLETYKKQLLTYKSLMEANGDVATSMILYFIEKDQEIRVDDIGFDQEKIDEIARNILGENFKQKTENRLACKFCPMRFYCDRA